MKEVLVLGKFMNFHKGHEALIRFAQTKGEVVRVIICATHTDRVRPFARLRDIKKTFGNSIIPEIFYYESCNLSGKEESDMEVSRAWAEVIHSAWPKVEAVIGSEKYIDYMASAGYFKGIMYDIDRSINSTSSTKVSQGAFHNYSHESKARILKHRKVYIVGPESSGKTTLSGWLSEKLVSEHVCESARDYMNEDGSFSQSDLTIFSLAHELSIRLGVQYARWDSMIIDSSAVTTVVYAMMSDMTSERITTTLLAEEKGLYLVMSPEVPWINDGTRHMNKLEDREDFFNRTISILRELDKDYVVIRGTDYDKRAQEALECCKSYLA